MTKELPPDVVLTGSSPDFTADTLPAALQEEHALGPGCWGVLHLKEGTAWFIDLSTGDEHHIEAPARITIKPETPHQLRLDGTIKCHIEFFRKKQT